MPNPRELKAERHDVIQAAEKIVRQARADGKDLAGSALEEYSNLIAKIKVLDSQIESLEQHGAARHVASASDGPATVVPVGPPGNTPTDNRLTAFAEVGRFVMTGRFDGINDIVAGGVRPGRRYSSVPTGNLPRDCTAAHSV